jgi:hypothetical protein
MTDFKRELSQRDLQDRALPPQKGFANTPRPPTLVLAMKRFLRKTLLWLARTAAILIVLLILFYAEEDWRGARDWAAYQKELQAKGETLDLLKLAPQGKPENDLSKMPIFEEKFKYDKEWSPTAVPKVQPRLSQIKVDLGINASPKGEPALSAYFPERWAIDLTAWQQFYRSVPDAHMPTKVGTPAEDVLQALSRYDSDLKEIDVAIGNPNAYWPNTSYLGPMETLLSVGEVLRLKAAAQIENHQTDLAEKSYLFSLRLGRPLAKSNAQFLFFPYQYLIAESILWEGLHFHAWGGSQLRDMEAALASPDFLASGVDYFRIERASILEQMEKLQREGPSMENLRSENPIFDLIETTFWIRPSGWWNQDRCRFCRASQERLEALDPARGILQSAAFPHHPPEENWEFPPDVSPWILFYTPLASSLIIGLDYEGPIIAKAETYRRLARLACRLEEYRIANGQYPETLDKLPDLPAHLNQEVLSERPLRYQRQGNGYQLYSVGWDPKDDGGKYDIDARKGDWPWPSP